MSLHNFLVSPGLYFDENDRIIAAVTCDQIELTSIAAKVARNRRETLSRQKLFAASLPPPAKPFRIGKQPSSKAGQPEQSSA